MTEVISERKQGISSSKREEIILLQDRKCALFQEERERSVCRPVIYRADAFLRNVKREHFEGTVISLGLFDRCSWIDCGDVTKEKNSLKVDVLIAFLADIGKGPENWAEISKKVVDDPITMRRLYDERFCRDLTAEIVQSALALDAIFVACFLMYACGQSPEIASLKETSHRLSQEKRNVIAELYNDIFKMENQIPLLLVRNVVAVMVQSLRGGKVEDYRIMADEYRSVTDEIFRTVCFSAQRSYMSRFPGLRCSKSNWELDSRSHLLHHVAGAFRDGGSAHSSKKSHFEGQSYLPERWTPSPKWLGINVGRNLHLPSVATLSRRGITFEGRDGFFPKLKPNRFAWWEATLFLPKISYIGGEVELCWRNLLAWEYNCEEVYKPFIQYLLFMDELIDSERDVSILLRGKNPVILGVGLGDNRAVANLFNSMTRNVIAGFDDEWTSLIAEINDFHNYRLGRLVGEFVQTYFSRPWLVISVFAAFVLLVATLLQTFYTILAYY